MSLSRSRFAYSNRLELREIGYFFNHRLLLSSCRFFRLCGQRSVHVQLERPGGACSHGLCGVAVSSDIPRRKCDLYRVGENGSVPWTCLCTESGLAEDFLRGVVCSPLQIIRVLAPGSGASRHLHDRFCVCRCQILAMFPQIARLVCFLPMDGLRRTLYCLHLVLSRHT